MRRALTVMIPAAALLAVACGTLFAPGAATVNGEEILSDEIEAALTRFENCEQFDQAAQQSSPNEVKREYEQTLLSRLIRREILELEAAEAGISVSAGNVEERLDQIREDFGSEKEFQNELEAQCVTLGEVRGFVRDSVLEQRLRQRVTEDVGPTEEELRAQYESREGDFTEVNVAHILVAGKAEAERLYRRLQETPAKDLEKRFAALAKEFSIDAGSASEGGELGYLSPSDVVPEFADAALALEEGEISKPVKSQFGWHIIRLIDARVRSFEDVRDQLAEELGGQEQESAWQDFLDAAYSDADIQLIVNDDAGSIPGGQPSPEPKASETPQPGS
jgi:parvulin-like peptidyl-prolyl isomerase